MGIGDWGLGIGDWGLGPIPNPQSPIPKSPIPNPPLNKFHANIKNNYLLHINYIKNNKLPNYEIPYIITKTPNIILLDDKKK